MDEKTCFIALTLIKGLGNVLISRLTGECGSAENVFKAAKTAGTLSEIDGVGADTENLVRNFSEWGRAEREVSEARKRGFDILTLAAPGYPQRLKNVHSAPAVLYVSGEIRESDSLAVAIVGSRYANKYGRESAKKLSYELAGAGVCVVSGMARGVDSAAHKAAVDAGGRTIAVLGSGLDVIYPPENHELYESISKNGAVISAFPLRTAPDKTHFPERNAVISGLSLGTVVVQAAKKSGALITAKLALEQNRDVFAVPGRINESISEGANSLIKQGAKLVESADDIISEIRELKDLQTAAQTKQQRRTAEEKIASLPQEKRKLLSLIKEKPLHIDEITEQSGETVASISALILELEIEGLVENSEGGMYQAKI